MMKEFRAISLFITALRQFVQYVKGFTQISSLHGVKYVFKKDLHFAEGLLWIGVLMASVHVASKLIAKSLQHYNENPTVITMQKNYKEWNITFPAATFCFIDNMDMEKAKAFIKQTWHVQPGEEDENLNENEKVEIVNDEELLSKIEENENFSTTNDTQSSNSTTSYEPAAVAASQPTVLSKYRYYLNFLQKLVNQTYENLGKFEEYVLDESLQNLNIVQTILKVIKEHKMKSTFYNKDFNNRDFHLTPTEMGMCYVHGGKLADYITLGDTAQIRENFQLPTCNYMNTLCYARTEGTPSDIRYYVHSPYEIPDISNPFFLVKGRMDRDLSFNSLETVVSAAIYNLSPSQRHCRFMMEPIAPHMKVYSFNLCRMQCRKLVAFEMCGCAPYFYTREQHIPICGVKGLACLSNHTEMLISLRSSTGDRLPCECLPQCIDNRYTVDREIIRQWMFPVPYDIRFRWAIEKFSTIRLRRDVIYSFDDLIVSFGGTAAFFFGGSLLSFVEILYFFSLSLFWFIVSNLRKKNSS